MNRLARRANRTAANPKPARPDYEQKLIEAGGKAWTSPDGRKSRIYFNDVERTDDGRKMTVCYDCNAQKWTEPSKYAAEFISILRDRINL